MKYGKKETVVITSFVLIIFLCIVGVTYGYFRATVLGNDTASTMVVEMTDLQLEYTDTNVINPGNILPGWEGTKTFRVENTGDKPVSYNIKLTGVNNNFVNDELVYKIESTNGGGILAETVVPTINGYLIRNISVAVDEIQEYTMTITFKETGQNQNSNMGKNSQER